MPILAAMITAGGGRFVPPLTIARTGLGLSAGQYRITDHSASFNYTLGGSATRSTNLVSLATTPSSGTVQAVAPKGVTASPVVNVARTPYTFHASYSYSQNCASHWSSGQCAAWGPDNAHFNGNVKNGTPANYTDSEGEWWRIWS
jgi:hypothetical protein